MVHDKYDFELACTFLEQKAYEELWKYALPYADSGDSNAQCLISLPNQYGLGTATDLEEAERWLRKATAQDNPVAWNNLGTLLMMKGENEKSKRCYQKAVALG